MESWRSKYVQSQASTHDRKKVAEAIANSASSAVS
jgi:hypothetical protein